MPPPGAYLPQHWQIWLRAYRPENGRLSAGDFRPDETVRLVFPDGSVAEFRAAFCAADHARGELAVFSEHCGYHVFALPDLEWTGRAASLSQEATKSDF
jgi:hypothetical protein